MNRARSSLFRGVMGRLFRQVHSSQEPCRSKQEHYMPQLGSLAGG